MTAALAGCAHTPQPETAVTTTPRTTTTTPPRAPLQLQIPSIGVSAQVLGVGVTTGDVTDAPEGPIHDPVWQEAFGIEERF